MRAQICALVSALAVSVAGHPTSPEITARQAPPIELPVLSWSLSLGTIDWQSPYSPGPNGYIRWTANWDVFANTDYVPGLPGFAVTCSGSFNDNNKSVGAWTLCSGFPGNATVEGQLTGESGFLATVRHNVTQNGKTTVTIASGSGGASQFKLTVQSVNTVD
ncbi:hypothetical protein F4860DRAFT_522525 [Xylaria cubensis]|nr:hypothetical protein F4860DRAFT_522525 [Xylaria cubensis]